LCPGLGGPVISTEAVRPSGVATAPSQGRNLAVRNSPRGTPLSPRGVGHCRAAADQQQTADGQQRERGIKWGGSKKGRILKLTPSVMGAIKDGRQRGESKTALARLLGLSWPAVHEACRRQGV